MNKKSMDNNYPDVIGKRIPLHLDFDSKVKLIISCGFVNNDRFNVIIRDVQNRITIHGMNVTQALHDYYELRENQLTESMTMIQKMKG